ncbi:hypothetical protein BT96DRAFT_485757 [Gymnopus androsaceus JB14]|uniref:Uncharacterized protein n=1 Tax=Gymnopus androsaceus JB14 TaxID=1447944 RepID=A0A6A4HY93_9AGAR|nr:hypothetical protein BT96DRAFT_485757 [Gymnopus androsaceus JB14]
MDGWLPTWQPVVSFRAMFNSIKNFTSLRFTRFHAGRRLGTIVDIVEQPVKI